MKDPFSSLPAYLLAKDPRVEEAKKLLLEAVHDHQRAIKGVSPSDPNLKKPYDELLTKFNQIRGGKLLFPFIGSGIGKGSLVQLLDGSVKYDFICGIGPHFFGHSHEKLISASIDGSLSDTIMQGHLQQNLDTVEFAEMLLKASKLDHCFLTTSGAMANENALKICFQKKFPAHRILAFEHCFVGRTTTLAQLTDKPTFRKGLPTTVWVDYIPYYDPENPEESTENAVKTLKTHLARYPNEYAAMIFELIQGEAGFHYGTTEFFKTLMTILKENNVAIFDDEIQSFGRLPSLFAFQYFGLENYVDVVSIGKLSQVCATLFKKEIAPKPGLLSQTFTGSTAALRAGQALIKELMEGDYYGPQGKIEKIHDYFVHQLKEIEKRHPHLIKGPYGLGCMIAFTPFDGSQEKANKLIQDLFQAGLMTFVAGSNPTRIRMLLPAGAITFEDLDKASSIIEETLLRS